VHVCMTGQVKQDGNVTWPISHDSESEYASQPGALEQKQQNP
jgi:hypothetical protein